MPWRGITAPKRDDALSPCDLDCGRKGSSGGLAAGRLIYSGRSLILGAIALTTVSTERKQLEAKPRHATMRRGTPPSLAAMSAKSRHGRRI